MLFFGLAGLSGCEVLFPADSCRDLCRTSALAIGDCIEDWGVDWSVLGATTQADYRNQCQLEWDDVRTGLEPRQVESADERCLEAATVVPDLSCDDLRAMYL